MKTALEVEGLTARLKLSEYFEAEFPRDQVGELSTEMVQHFFASLSQSLGAAMHLKVEGGNTHHMVEALFKGAGRALKPALARQGSELPSTKGML